MGCRVPYSKAMRFTALQSEVISKTSEIREGHMRLIRRRFSVTAGFLAGLIGSGIEGASSAEDKFALSEKFHIKIDYPDSWAQLPPKIPNEVFALWSSLGKGTAGCTIAANDTKITPNTDESIVAAYQLVPQLMEGRLLEGYREPKVIDRKITTLSNLKAISIVASGPYSTLGKEASWRQWSMITQKQGVVYTITCVDLDDRFQASLPVFRKIMSSFFIYP
jgi:hypothetical protein